MWVLGEYSYLLVGQDQAVAMQLMCTLLERENFSDTATKCFVVTAVSKLIAQGGGNVEVPPAIKM